MATADLQPPSLGWLEAVAAAKGGGGGCRRCGHRRGAVVAQHPTGGDQLLGCHPRHLLLHQGSVREPPRRLHRRHLHRLCPHGMGRAIKDLMERGLIRMVSSFWAAFRFRCLCRRLVGVDG